MIQDTNVTHTLYDIDQTRPGRANVGEHDIFRFHDLSVAVNDRPEFRKSFRFLANLPAEKLFFVYADHNNAATPTRTVSVTAASILFKLIN